MTGKQIMRVHTAVGAEKIDADRLLVQNDEYVFLNRERGDPAGQRSQIS